MNAHRIPLLTAFAGAAALLSGCLDSDTAPSSVSSTSDDDQSAIQAAMVEDEDASEYSTVDLFSYVDPADGPSAAPILTQRWRREALDVSRNVRIAIESSNGVATANVQVSGHVIGLLHLWAGEGDSFQLYDKDFQNDGSRHLVFQRDRDRDRLRDRIRDRERHRGWRLVALSGVALPSPGTTRQIKSVRVQAGDVDETITDVTQLVRIQDLMQLPEGAVAEITVDTGDATDAVFLHYRRLQRSEMHNNGDGTFSARMPVFGERGPGHFAVDVLSEGTLYDDVAPYDNLAWGIPFLVPGDRGGDDSGDDGSDGSGS
jgi:hypothetical protein